jgi:hypothetical protein
LKPAQVHWAHETFAAQVIDYDLARDVGLICIRPGRRLPASRVVPASWRPTERMRMTTVGCSEGQDATAWTTMIVKPFKSFDNEFGRYEAVECVFAPKQGRSGGGLYTDDGYVAGVCDFADPRGLGLYATPRSVHHILDRNNLMALYAPNYDRPETLLAGNHSRPTRGNAPPLTRGQSPDGEETDVVMIPPPHLLGIKDPVSTAETEARPASDQRTAWRSTHRASDQAQTERTDLKINSAADNDRFASLPSASETAVADPTTEPTPPVARGTGAKWRRVRSASPALAGERP